MPPAHSTSEKSRFRETALEPLALTGTIGVIGSGVMGQALIKGLIQSGLVPADKIWAATKTEKSRQKVAEDLGVSAYLHYEDILTETEIILLCVKPSKIKEVLEHLKRANLSPKTLIISIVAGTTLQMLQDGIGGKNPIIRAMTNTPCIVREGMTVICPGDFAEKEHMRKARTIFEAVGLCMDLEESFFDAITGLSGSGPAYLYLIMEALADGGVRVGLPREAALKIVAQTVLGAAVMVQKTGRHPAALRDDVTTPAGCTIGALLTMEDGKIRSVLARAVEEAAQIASQLGSK